MYLRIPTLATGKWRFFNWLSSPYAGITIVLTLLLILLLHESRRTGLTIDEPSHFAAGYSYWLGDDSLQPADTPPLTRLISGWIPRLLSMNPPPSARAGGGGCVCNWI